MTRIHSNNGVNGSRPVANQTGRAKAIERNAQRFQQMLEQEIGSAKSVKLSAHAMQRLEQRDINLSSKDLEALNRGLDKAEAKGARESLLLYKDLAFVASVRNRTVITAVGQKDTKENVFTNIDSAVIIDE